ncbi:MAG: AtzE family amidohydrolase [Betaproteobacteria bacterium]
MSADLALLGAAELAQRIRAGQCSATVAVQAALARIDALDARYNCFTAVTRDRALARAAALDATGAAGPLAGVPFAVKNLFDLAGLPTLAGSKINREHPPAAQDAPLVQRLEAAGAICVGALNMDEYAYGFTTENAHDGATRNPHDPTRIASGSSGGSAAAVAAGLVPFTLGSDTNGSIRVPSSLTGIFGLKPTYGRLPRTGSYPFVASLDHLGPFARGTRDLAIVYDALQGPDPADPACAQRAVEPTVAALAQGVAGLRIAVAGGYFEQQATPAARAVVQQAAAALGATQTVELPEAARARAAAFVITMAEGGNLHFADLARRPFDFDFATRDRFIAGTLVPAHYVAQAQRFRQWYRQQVARLFERVDVILTAATPVPATAIGQATMELNGQTVAVRPTMGLLTQPISFIGLPVAVAPVQRPGALPLGVQIIAAPWREDHALRVAAALEAAGVASAPIAAGALQ